MFVRKGLRRLPAGAMAALAVGVIIAGVPSPVLAKGAKASASSTSGAEAFGKGKFGVAKIATENEAAAATGPDKNSAESSGTSNSTAIGGKAWSHTRTRASAKAVATTKYLEASAQASVDTAAGVGGAVVGATHNWGTAYAHSGKKGDVTAYAASSNGAYAHAFMLGGVGMSTTFVPDGITTTQQNGRRSYSFTYAEIGSYAFAMTRGRQAFAITGTSENAVALASGNLAAFAHSGMFAAAFAGRGSAWASAGAWGGSYAGSGMSSASTSGYSFAHAYVTRVTGGGLVRVSDKCRYSNLEKVSGVQHECIVKRKVAKPN